MRGYFKFALSAALLAAFSFVAYANPIGGPIASAPAPTRASVINCTDNTTLTSKQAYNAVVTNTGAGGAIVITLPAAEVGMEITFVLTVAQDVDINPALDNTDTIAVLTNAAGDAISSAATIGNYVKLVAVTANTWMPVGSSGTWTDVN